MIHAAIVSCRARRRLARLLVVPLLLGLSWPRPLVAAELDRAAPGPSPRIVNGVLTQDFPAVGALLRDAGGNVRNADTWCSGTLVGCRTFLTAGHCGAGESAEDLFVYLQHGGLYTVSSVVVHPSFDFPLADVAVLTLEREVSGIDPLPINTLADPAGAGHGLDGTIVGFGRTRGGVNDFGIKRTGAVETLACREESGGTDVELVCWDFANPVGEPGQDSNTCNGDSGGPLLLDVGAGPVVAGVTSGGENAACLAADHSYDANVFTYRDFLLSQLGEDSTAPCGELPAVGSAEARVVKGAGRLDTNTQQAAFAIEVPAATNELRIALNGSEEFGSGGTFDADLFVKLGSPASTSNFDCKADGPTSYGACTVTFPPAGTWHVLVRRAAGGGDYQLTATVFGGDAPVCGNGDREFSEICDGADAPACPGRCLGNCTCPPPQCGNGSHEAGEGCDDGDLDTGDGCDASCIVEECGNAVVQTGEECDDGNMIETDACLGNCFDARCGDAALWAGNEECDDGGTMPDDGCDAECNVEPVDVGTGGEFAAGFEPGGRDVFALTLAQGAKLVAEIHDGSGTCPPSAAFDTILTLFGIGSGDPIALAFDDDGGDNLCSLIEASLPPGTYELVAAGFGGIGIASYTLRIELTEPVCGDGVLDYLEECDDGNVVSGDCCSQVCAIETSGRPCPDDANPCTDDRCDSVGRCAHPPNSVACDDGDPCTTGDLCLGGVCSSTDPTPNHCVVEGVCFACGQPTGLRASPTSTDALFVLRVAVGRLECEQCVCDVNGNADITATDALAVLQKAVGRPDVELTCSTSTTSTTFFAATSSTTTTTQVDAASPPSTRRSDLR